MFRHPFDLRRIISDLRTLNEIVEELDYHSLWFKWMTEICPSPKDICEFDNKNKKDQVNYLKEKLK